MHVLRQHREPHLPTMTEHHRQVHHNTWQPKQQSNPSTGREEEDAGGGEEVERHREMERWRERDSI